MIVADYHTHSVYSKDAHSTLEENILMAIQKGLKEIAVTEHSYTNLNGIKKGQFAEIKKEVERLRKAYPQISILFGMEANLINGDGDIDLSKEEQDQLDIVVLGYHKSCKSFKNFFRHLKMSMRFSKKQTERNTDAYIKAMEKNKVTILAHLGYVGKVNVVRLAEAALKNNVLVEFNRKQNWFTPHELKKMVEMGVKFVANSDAHKAEDIGENYKGVNYMLKYNIPENQMMNWNKVIERRK